MLVAELIAALQQHDPSATVVLSMYPVEGAGGDWDAVAVERSDICAVLLLAVDNDEYRKRYAVVLENGVPGVWLG